MEIWYRVISIRWRKFARKMNRFAETCWGWGIFARKMNRFRETCSIYTHRRIVVLGIEHF